MQTVKAMEALPGYPEGAVFTLDEDSAKVLEERGHVEFVEDGERTDPGAAFVTAAARRSNASVTQIAEADYPESGISRDEEDGDEDESAAGAADPGPVTKASNKSDLVAAAVGTVKHDDGSDFTEAELESLSKAELTDKLGL